jgi:hypothetical protein
MLLYEHLGRRIDMPLIHIESNSIVIKRVIYKRVRDIAKSNVVGDVHLDTLEGNVEVRVNVYG